MKIRKSNFEEDFNIFLASNEKDIYIDESSDSEEDIKEVLFMWCEKLHNMKPDEKEKYYNKHLIINREISSFHWIKSLAHIIFNKSIFLQIPDLLISFNIISVIFKEWAVIMVWESTRDLNFYWLKAKDGELSIMQAGGEWVNCLFQYCDIKFINPLGLLDFKNLKLYHSNINSFDITSTLSIEKIEIENFNSLNSMKFEFNNITAKELIIKKSHLKSDYCKFSNLDVTEKLVIDDVDFWKTVFNNVKFPKEKNKFINHPIFNECVFNEVDFWDYVIYSTENSEEERKETYRQLKHLMEKNSNFTESNKFYTLEMEQYRKDNKTSWWDKIILFIQKWSSNYWQNWLFPAFWIIVASLSFSMYNYLSPEDYCPYSFMKIWEKYLAWPLTLKDDINIMNFIYLLIYAFLSYQLIISLRKNTKK